VIRFLIRSGAAALLVYVLGYAFFAVMLPKAAGDERTDAIIVLTGGTGRLDRGFALMERRLARAMLISGVARTVRPEELVEAYHVDPQLLACCITLGREAFDTRSNADEAARWLQGRNYRSIRLVTNDLHMPRARYEIRKRLGPDIAIVTDAVPTEPGFRQIFIEYNKYLLGRVAEWIGI
jgi:uncharacterized SAM-binding protein YcdF (DUF218 family)